MTNNLHKKIMGGPAPWARRAFTGFTLVETLFAIFILMVALVGPLTVASRALNAALQAKNKTTALYLAQDAMEYVRYKRDSSRLAGASWLSALHSCTSINGAANCQIDSNTDTIVACVAGACSGLNYMPASALYTYTAADGVTILSTIFRRRVYITTPVCDSSGNNCNSDDAQVKVVVSWTDVNGVLGLQRTVALQEDMLNWQ